MHKRPRSYYFINFFTSLFLIWLLSFKFADTAHALQTGDINGDGHVDIIDIGIIIDSYGRIPIPNPRADLNGDGRADIIDIGIVVDNYGRNPTPVPTVGPSSPPANNLTDCSGYTPKRVFLETQAWWMDTNSITGPVPPGQKPLNGIGGHAHSGTCFPEDQVVPDGVMHFNVRLMLHKGQVGKIDWLDIGLGPDGRSLSHKTFSPNITCPGGADINVMCEMWIPIDLNVDGSIPAGYQELRFRFHIIQPNGEEQFSSTGWQAYFHGNTTNHYRTPPFLEARGWYTGAEYEVARLSSAFPFTPLSGSWTFRTVLDIGFGGIPVASHGIHVDARFNRDDFGTIILEGPGPYNGNATIDTTQFTNGVHCVAFRTSSINHNGGTDTGILQFPITINNPGYPFGNGKGGCAPGT